ncbi:hypothetical protein CPB83DRAFT_860029 [Crepidotus variabilis]|uniref:Uncharacterized protein n=1 Tax=Crepidotus variabilis TaxID=179855 RepID=A0A9P6JLQ9_9AGAR|nr:hypothetical protein CPB83DRAFT_860029 [Crepidotus variabilis]
MASDRSRSHSWFINSGLSLAFVSCPTLSFWLCLFSWQIYLSTFSNSSSWQPFTVDAHT